MTDAALLRHLARHEYRDEIVEFLAYAAIDLPPGLWSNTLLDLAEEIEMESRR
jgi:hypothetical protein